MEKLRIAIFSCQRWTIPYFPNAMKMLIAAIFFMVSSASLLAQGKIGGGSVISQLAWFDSVPQALPSSAILDTSNWLPPSQRAPSTSDDLSLIEGSRQRTTLINSPLTPVPPPTPLTDSSSGIAPVFQTSSLTIQAVPEPSSFALLAVGLLIGAAIFRRSRLQA